jgi:molybdenum cofactor cytidylyltransferase
MCAVVLAAGQSRRMGVGVQKLLLPFAGSTVIGHILDQLVAAKLTQIIIVVGHDPAVAAAVMPRPVTIVRNEDPEADMLSSARCGVRALPADCNAVLLVLGDQPSITPQLIRLVTEAYGTGSGGIVVPVFEGHRGHPLLFAAPYARQLLDGYDGEGVRGLLRSHADDVFELHVSDRGVVADMDLPEDYRRELERLGGDGIRGGADRE